MNIILFCRILSVDFSYILKVGRSDEGRTEKLSNGASWKQHNTKPYANSVISEEEHERKERIE